MKINSIFCFLTLITFSSFSQVDSTYQEEEDDEDYSMYDDVEDVGTIVTYCSPKIFDLSPNRFVSLGYDYTGMGALTTSPEGTYAPDADVMNEISSKINYHGLRLNANIPVISLSKFVWQMGGGINQSRFSGEELDTISDHSKFVDAIERNLTSFNLNTTLFKPLNENSFLIVQLMAEQNGNFNFNSSATTPDLANTRFSASALWGKRPHDRLQWAVGLSRTFRAGALNYIPLIMYNYTSKSRRWGTEILFPARAAYRRKFNPRNILLAGYELEGTSYRLYDTELQSKNLELRRSEIRVRLDYQRQIKGFLWVGIQAGMIVNYSFDVDSFTATDNKEFYRGFFGDQTFVFKNGVSPVP
ncbi:MAG: hypothetical protein ABF240_07055, partial [Flavobacteriales bacterium]